MNKVVELFHAIYDTELIWNFLLCCVGLLVVVYLLELLNDEMMKKYLHGIYEGTVNSTMRAEPFNRLHGWFNNLTRTWTIIFFSPYFLPSNCKLNNQSLTSNTRSSVGGSCRYKTSIAIRCLFISLLTYVSCQHR